MVPTSTWPKPSSVSASMPWPSLSKPAASPNGEGKVRPNAWVCREAAGAVNFCSSRPAPQLWASRMALKPILWARSASIHEKASRKNVGYTRMPLVFRFGRVQTKPARARTCAL